MPFQITYGHLFYCVRASNEAVDCNCGAIKCLPLFASRHAPHKN